MTETLSLLAIIWLVCAGLVLVAVRRAFDLRCLSWRHLVVGVLAAPWLVGRTLIDLTRDKLRIRR